MPKPMSNEELTMTILLCFTFFGLVGISYLVAWAAFKIADRRQAKGKRK